MGKRETSFLSNEFRHHLIHSAFEKLHPDFIIHLRHNVTALRAVLLSHVVPNTWYSAGLSNGQQLKTIYGNKVVVGVTQDGT